MKSVKAMHLALPTMKGPAKLILDLHNPFNEKLYAEFCAENPDLRLERNANGEVIIVPPAGGESSYRSLSVASQLERWALRTVEDAPSIPASNSFFQTNQPAPLTRHGFQQNASTNSRSRNAENSYDSSPNS